MNDIKVKNIIEHGYPSVNIHYSGNTLVIDPMGQVLYHMAEEEDINTITLSKEKLEEVRTRFPFLNDGDDFIINS